MQRRLPFLVLIVGLLFAGGTIAFSTHNSSADSEFEQAALFANLDSIPEDQTISFETSSSAMVMAQLASTSLPYRVFVPGLAADSAPGNGNPSPLPTPTVTPTRSPSATGTATNTPTPSATPSPTRTNTPGTGTSTPIPTATFTPSPTNTATATPTGSTTVSPTATFTATATNTVTATATNTSTATATNTATATATSTQPACETTGQRTIDWAVGVEFQAPGGPVMTAGTINPFNGCEGGNITVNLSFESPTPIEWVAVGYTSTEQSGGCISSYWVSGCPDPVNGIMQGTGTALPATSGSWSFTFPHEGQAYPISLRIYVKNGAMSEPWLYDGQNWIQDVPPGP